MDLLTGAVIEGPATLAGPETPEEFTQLLNPNASAFLLQTNLAAFAVVELPSLKVGTAAKHPLSNICQLVRCGPQQDLQHAGKAIPMVRDSVLLQQEAQTPSVTLSSLLVSCDQADTALDAYQALGEHLQSLQLTCGSYVDLPWTEKFAASLLTVGQHAKFAQRSLRGPLSRVSCVGWPCSGKGLSDSTFSTMVVCH